MKSIDLTGQQVVALRDVETAAKAGATELLVCSRGILTPSARDFIQRNGLTLRKAEKPAAVCSGCSGCSGCKTEHPTAPAPAATNSDLERLFHSPEAEAIRPRSSTWAASSGSACTSTATVATFPIASARTPSSARPH